MRRVRLGTAAAATALVASVLAGAPTAPASATTSVPCLDGESDVTAAQPGFPLVSMKIAQAQRWLADHGKGQAGEGVVVAVLDSGVSTLAPISLAAPQVKVSNLDGAEFYHGTAVAGIIAGRPEADGSPVGIAPGAKVLDVKIYDSDEDTSDGGIQVSTQTVGTGLLRVLDAVRGGMPIKVVNVSVSVDDAADISSEVQQLWDAGVVVVASSGNRSISPDDERMKDFMTYQPGENAAEKVYPAGYDLAVAATTTAAGMPDTDPLQYILRNTQIDVAVPTSGAPTYAVAGTPCVLKTPATSWAAAEVSGVLAMLAGAYPGDTPAQLVARLVETTDGRSDLRSPLTGAGVAQPYDALTLPLDIDPDGTMPRSVPVTDEQAASLPPRTTDPLASTRGDIVWFGVVGGIVLVLALVLRPVLARRRRS